VIGQLTVYNGINKLEATHIRPVLDMHEPFFHYLEAMVALVSNTQMTSVGGPLFGAGALPAKMT
jgi:hypothetical protein